MTELVDAFIPSEITSATDLAASDRRLRAVEEARHLFQGVGRTLDGTGVRLEALHRRPAESDFDHIGDGLDLYVGLIETDRNFFNLELPARGDESPERVAEVIRAVADICDALEFSPVEVIRFTDSHLTPRWRPFTNDLTIVVLPVDSVSTQSSPVWEGIVTGDGTPGWRSQSGLSPLAHHVASLVGELRYKRLRAADPAAARLELDSVTRALRIGESPRPPLDTSERQALWARQVRCAVSKSASLNPEALIGELTAVSLGYQRRVSAATAEVGLASERLGGARNARR